MNNSAQKVNELFHEFQQQTDSVNSRIQSVMCAGSFVDKTYSITVNELSTIKQRIIEIQVNLMSSELSRLNESIISLAEREVALIEQTEDISRTIENTEREIQEYQERIREHELKKNELKATYLKENREIKSLIEMEKILEDKKCRIESEIPPEFLDLSSNELINRIEMLKLECALMESSIEENQEEICKVSAVNRTNQFQMVHERESFELEKASLIQQINAKKELLERKVGLENKIAWLQSKLKNKKN